ncbi:MAG: methyltransferase domain-containing protein, partial [Deltaproteobacteria bacterium]|nr:methyltransferase domain-containing protein [Deltaproteobacteria bacterium]
EMVQRESLSSYHQAAGEAEGLPFQGGKFDRCFVAFSLHHFKDPALMVKDSLRVLKPRGRLVVLDPVVVEPQDNIDHSIHEVVNRVFGGSHGGVFRFHTAKEIRQLIEGAGFKVTRSDVHQAPFDQDGMDGIPTGRHWLEAAEELAAKPEMKKRFEENYFQFWRSGDKTHVKGRFHFALICGEKI